MDWIICASLQMSYVFLMKKSVAARLRRNLQPHRVKRRDAEAWFDCTLH
jgi:hypothetical protein